MIEAEKEESAQADRLRDEVIRRMANTPPKRQDVELKPKSKKPLKQDEESE